MRLSVYEYKDGVSLGEGLHAAYDIANDKGYIGVANITGHALVWRLNDDGAGALLSEEFELDPKQQWLMRLDRVDFPPGAIAYTHTHPGPGIRCTIQGSVQIDTRGGSHVHHAYSPWFETGPDPVYAPGSESEHSAFVRVILLPREWRGRRTIHYVDPADAERARQYASIYLEQDIEV